MDEIDYGYGEDLDYGYDEQQNIIAAPAAGTAAIPSSTLMADDDDDTITNVTTIPQTVRQSLRRRCSVTKFSLENNNNNEAPTILTAASVIDAMRHGTTHDNIFPSNTSTSGLEGDDSDDMDRRIVTPHNSSDFCCVEHDKVGAVALGNEMDVVVEEENDVVTVPVVGGIRTKTKMNGVLHRILSIRRR